MMDKLITDNPSNMREMRHNFVFVKDKEVFVRTNDGDISLVKYIRKMDKELYNIDHDDDYCNAIEFGEYMDDDRFTCDMYWALVGFAEVREKLKIVEEQEVKIFSIDDGEQHNIVAYTKDEAIDYYMKELNFGDIQKCDLEVREILKDDDIRVNLSSDDDILIELINRYRNKNDRIEEINIWDLLEYNSLEKKVRDEKEEIPYLISSSVF